MLVLTKVVEILAVEGTSQEKGNGLLWRRSFPAPLHGAISWLPVPEPFCLRFVVFQHGHGVPRLALDEELQSWPRRRTEIPLLPSVTQLEISLEEACLADGLSV